VLKDIADLGITEIVNLGDHVSGPLEPSRTADLLIERGFPSVRGDQDRRQRAHAHRASCTIERWADDRQSGRRGLTWL
jgi:hypothetical protein